MAREPVSIEPPKNFRIVSSGVDIGELNQVTEFEYSITTMQKADLAGLIDGVNLWLKARQQVLVNLFETETLHRYTILTSSINQPPVPR